MAVHKKKPAADKTVAGKEEKLTTPVVVSDMVTETTERVEIIEDPLTDFKEKMNEEEKSLLDEPQGKNFMWPILFIFIIVVVLLVGIFTYKQGIFKGEKANVVSPSPTPTITPEPTKVAVDLTKYEIEILNGSEVAGEAGRQQASLEEEGFTVSAIGNADNSDYTDTLIKAKKEVEKAFLDKLKGVLESAFIVEEIRTLPASSSSPVVVILGTKK